uniref:C2H2-type domain-containing protein n=1 Tax=Phlebotomus papatasi TaxID=29031 RepID=A0A1B0DHL8_PHLPP
NPNNLNYHRQCHTTENCGIACPECKNTDFRNWNTLHTHLWREHQIDMELYSCELCNFKTPVLSRLKNTHVKIHSEERNFKCEICEKKFKNTKQLKNHRRIHRSATEQLPVIKCELCSTTVITGRQYKRHLRNEHGCSDGPDGHTCGVCGKVMNSMAALTVHKKKHEDGEKISCTECDYTTHDHNAARRHRMKHEKEKQYKCPFCRYKTIQSTTYRMLPTPPADQNQHLPLIRPALFSKTFSESVGGKNLKLTDCLEHPPSCDSPQYPNIDLT